MSRAFDPTSDADDQPPPGCAPTLARIQSALDGVLSADELDGDPHPATCAACHGRIRAARLLLGVRPKPVAVPAGLADTILAGVRADRRARTRRRTVAVAGGCAAAAVLVAVWAVTRTPDRPEAPAPKPAEFALPAPPPKPEPEPIPPPRPVRINDDLARASDALLDTSRTFTEPAAVAPRVFAALTEPLLKPMAPLAPDLEPARQSLADIPDAARTGLEPVTGSAQKAFTRLLRDVSAIQPGKPKS
jgi:hypothetical protein